MTCCGWVTPWRKEDETQFRKAMAIEAISADPVGCRLEDAHRHEVRFDDHRLPAPASGLSPSEEQAYYHRPRARRLAIDAKPFNRLAPDSWRFTATMADDCNPTCEGFTGFTAASPLAPAAVWRERLRPFEVHAIPAEGRRRAAVALVLVEAGHGAEIPGMPRHADWSGAAALVLTRRAAAMRAHAGQWALPGGRIDEGETPSSAALRELREEVGLHLQDSDVIGPLDDYATRSGYVITPVLVWGGAARRLQANPEEVASIHRLPVHELRRADAPLLNHVRGAPHPVLRMPVGSGWIAAPTAAFLYQFAEWLLCGRATRVAHFDQPRFAWR